MDDHGVPGVVVKAHSVGLDAELDAAIAQVHGQHHAAVLERQVQVVGALACDQRQGTQMSAEQHRSRGTGSSREGGSRVREKT